MVDACASLYLLIRRTRSLRHFKVENAEGEWIIGGYVGVLFIQLSRQKYFEPCNYIFATWFMNVSLIFTGWRLLHIRKHKFEPCFSEKKGWKSDCVWRRCRGVRNVARHRTFFWHRKRKYTFNWAKTNKSSC